MRSNDNNDEDEENDTYLQELITKTKKFFNNEFKEVKFIKTEERREVEEEITENFRGLPHEIRDQIKQEYQNDIETHNQQTNVINRIPILKEYESKIQFDIKEDKFQIDPMEFKWEEPKLPEPEKQLTHEEWLSQASNEELRAVIQLQEQEIRNFSWMYQNE